MSIQIDSSCEKLTEGIIGAAFEVANVLGHGFLEVIYRKALLHELVLRGFSTRQEVPFQITYKGAAMGCYVADLVVENRVIVELKAVEGLNGHHVGQLLNYLKASRTEVGLLLNFGKPRLEFKRVLR